MTTHTELDEGRFKDITDLNLKALAGDFANVLNKHVGGQFAVVVKKVEQTQPGYNTNRLLIQFEIEDEHWHSRPPRTQLERSFEEGGFQTKVR